MRSTALFLALALLHFGVASPSFAGAADEASAQILLDTLRANKKAFVAVNLELSDTEASEFWPVYDQYQIELDGVQARLLEVIDAYKESFGSLGDAAALELVEDYLAVERDRAAVRSKFLGPITEVLPGRKVMRFYQIENKIEAVLRHELASTVPVIEQ